MKRPFFLFLFLFGFLLGIYACNSAYQPNYKLRDGQITKIVEEDTTDYGDDEETDLQIP